MSELKLPFGFVSVLQLGEGGPVEEFGSDLACTVPLIGDETFEG